MICRLLFNCIFNSSQACYTFDAGPNACIFLPAENVPLFEKLITHFFSPANVDQELVRGEMEKDKCSEEAENNFQVNIFLDMAKETV